MSDKKCSICGSMLPLSAFGAHAGNRDGLTSACLRCKYMADAKWRSENRDKVRASRAKHYAANKESISRKRRGYPSYKKNQSGMRNAAWMALNRAVRSGKIVRPDACERCGRAVEVHGHHADYSKKLDVVWLCRACHAIAHMEANHGI